MTPLSRSQRRAGALLAAALLATVAQAGCSSSSTPQDGGADLDVAIGPDGPGLLCEERAPSQCQTDSNCRLVGCIDECGLSFQLCVGVSGDCPPTVGKTCTSGSCDQIETEAACNGTIITPEPGRSITCVSDYCALCDPSTGMPLGQVWVGCRNEKQSPYPCPDPSCQSKATECRFDTDCGLGRTCVAPGEKLCGGACQPVDPPCESDMDCKGMGAGFICEVPRCACQPQATCIPGCGAGNPCATGEACNQEGRCVPQACKQSSECPADFECFNGLCNRPDCINDDDCAGGVCVNGFCYSQLGTCAAPAP